MSDYSARLEPATATVFSVPAPVSGAFALASWSQRVGAALVDLLVLLPTWAGCVLLGVTAKPVVVSADASLHGGFTGVGLLGLGVGALYALLVGLWQLSRQGAGGQTLGMQAVGIRLVREADGQVLGFDGAVIRALAHLFEFGVGFFLPLWDDKRQTVADKLCRTQVVVVR